MLHFVQPAVPPGAPVRWRLWPEGRLLTDPEFAAVLEAMPKPAIVAAHVERGGVTALPLASVVPEARPRLEHEWRNQSRYLGAKLEPSTSGAGPTSVLLELDDGELMVSTADLVTWATEYVLTSCGWTVEDSGGDSRAPLRMLLRRPDGTWSPGRTCDRRDPAT
jgi:hypothetical protein